MSIESPVPSVPALSKEASSQDCSDDDQDDSYVLIEALAKRRPDLSRVRLSPEFAERNGSNVLLCMGIVLFLIGCSAFVLGHTTVGILLVTTAVAAVIVATGLGRLVLVKLDVFKLVGFLAKFGSKGADEDESDEGADA
jgi:hypothetical protein